jgi:uncharacterized protein YggE
MKNNIFKIILLSVGLILFAASLYIYRPNHNKYTRVTVIGNSQTKIAPDTALITFSVVTQGSQALNVQQENARKSEAVKMAIETIISNVKHEIKTSDYSLNPERDYAAKMPKISGYEVKNTLTVSINDLKQVGAVIDAATKAGANSVDGISFVLGEASPAQGEALALATKQAMAKAESIAQSLNGKVVRVVESNEGGVPIQSSRTYSEFSNAMAGNTASVVNNYQTPVQAGSLNVQSQVILVVEVEVNQ